MKYIKTFESFELNETLDMMTMPVDPIKGAADVWGDVWNSVGEFVEEGKEWFYSKLEQFVDHILKALDVKEIIKRIESYFGVDVHDLTIKKAFDILMRKNRNLIKESNDVEYQKHKNSDSFQISLEVLQGIFGVNAFGGGIVAIIAGVISDLAFNFDLAAWAQSLGVDQALTNPGAFGFIPGWCIVSLVAMGIIAIIREIDASLATSKGTVGKIYRGDIFK